MKSKILDIRWWILDKRMQMFDIKCWMLAKQKSKIKNLISIFLAFTNICYLTSNICLYAEPPRKVKDGIEFSYKAPTAKSVHLAGSFNNWAENQEGKVTKPEYLMSKGADGVWRKTVKLGGGKHAYKFVINGTEWVADPSIKQQDHDGNSVILLKGTPAPSAGQEVKSGELAPKEVTGGVKFSYKGNAKKVTIAGEFNRWNMDATPMTEEKPGLWSAVVPLPAGEHQYKFVVDGQWMNDPSNPVKVGEYQNSMVKVTKGVAPAVVEGGPRKVAGGWEFSFRAPQAKTVHLAGSFNNWADNQNGVVSNAKHLMTKGSDGVWRKTIPLSPGKIAYKFVIDGNNWSPDPNNPGPRDKDDNSLFEVK